MGSGGSRVVIPMNKLLPVGLGRCVSVSGRGKGRSTGSTKMKRDRVRRERGGKGERGEKDHVRIHRFFDSVNVCDISILL